MAATTAATEALAAATTTNSNNNGNSNNDDNSSDVRSDAGTVRKQAITIYASQGKLLTLSFCVIFLLSLAIAMPSLPCNVPMHTLAHAVACALTSLNTLISHFVLINIQCFMVGQASNTCAIFLFSSFSFLHEFQITSYVYL